MENETYIVWLERGSFKWLGIEDGEWQSFDFKDAATRFSSLPDAWEVVKMLDNYNLDRVYISHNGTYIPYKYR